MRQLYRSANGDAWFLARDPETGLAFVQHQANASSGGQVTQIDLDAFLSGELHPEQETLLRRIANFILDPRRADASDDEWSAASTGGQWSDVELRELRDMLLRGLSIEEIKRLLRRDH